MRPPKVIKVGPFPFRVVRKPDKIADGEKVGDTSIARSRIRYAADQSMMQKRATLLHEVLHAVAHTAAIDDEEKLTQEEWIGRIESGLLGVLRENPDLVKFLTLYP
jgi:hypothetical protein